MCIHEPATPSGRGSGIEAQPSIPGADAAIRWTASDPLNPRDGTRRWFGWCLCLVKNAYRSAGYEIGELDVETAHEAFVAFKWGGAVIHEVSATPPPRGAVVFFDSYEGDQNVGHIVISNGDGTCVSTCPPGEGYFGGQIDLRLPLRAFGRRSLGWVDPSSRR